MKIKYIHVKNFKSFNDQEINLQELNILLGQNASGKSNTVAIIRFINNIVLYGIDDAISLLGGINYAINATIGKDLPIYIKFIFDVSDEKWVRSIDRKETKTLWLEEIVSEFEIIAHKKGMGYRIGKENLTVKYKECYKEKEKFIKRNNDYIIMYERKRNKVKYQFIDKTSFKEESIKKMIDSIGGY